LDAVATDGFNDCLEVRPVVCVHGKVQRLILPTTSHSEEAMRHTGRFGARRPSSPRDGRRATGLAQRIGMRATLSSPCNKACDATLNAARLPRRAKFGFSTSTRKRNISPSQIQ
ncbi:hypothetical protein HAX54_040652, partial [Datura stramonium]|nr:hypothetical protein [Datura stramonium]